MHRLHLIVSVNLETEEQQYVDGEGPQDQERGEGCIKQDPGNPSHLPLSLGMMLERSVLRSKGKTLDEPRSKGNGVEYLEFEGGGGIGWPRHNLVDF